MIKPGNETINHQSWKSAYKRIIYLFLERNMDHYMYYDQRKEVLYGLDSADSCKQACDRRDYCHGWSFSEKYFLDEDDEKRGRCDLNDEDINNFNNRYNFEYKPNWVSGIKGKF